MRGCHTVDIAGDGVVEVDRNLVGGVAGKPGADGVDDDWRLHTYSVGVSERRLGGGGGRTQMEGAGRGGAERQAVLIAHNWHVGVHLRRGGGRAAQRERGGAGGAHDGRDRAPGRRSRTPCVRAGEDG